MSFFSSWIKAIFIISLAFPLYSEAALAPLPAIREPPTCIMYDNEFDPCTRENDPVCATNGRTYVNRCVFCTEMLKFPHTVAFGHYGKC
ncbi:sperm-associated acrosin inhibitor-like [Hipposideros larvatus]